MGRRFVPRVAREPVSLLREIFGQAILVMSGQSRKMYLRLVPKAGGINLLEGVQAPAVASISSRRYDHHDRWPEMNIQAVAPSGRKLPVAGAFHRPRQLQVGLLLLKLPKLWRLRDSAGRHAFCQEAGIPPQGSGAW